jgi:hypothetical protein
MRKSSLIFSTLALLASHSQALTTVYTQNFDAPLGAEWTVGAGWDRITFGTGASNFQPGINSITSTVTGGYGTGWQGDDDGAANNNFALPRAPILGGSPSSFSAIDPRFGGGALINNSNGAGTFTSTLTLTGLASHTVLDVGFVMGLGDSLDAADGAIRILIDGTPVMTLNGNGAQRNEARNLAGNVVLAQDRNLSGQYGESVDPSWAAPGTYSWTVEDAYDMNGVGSLSVPHSASTATITFEHALDNLWTDEFVLYDSLTIQTDAIPEPGMTAMLGVALGGLFFGRRRRA